MLLLERNALVTISPKFDKLPEGSRRYRWSMHISLPFPFPSRKCVADDVTAGDQQYKFEIHNHFDRVTVAVPGGGYPRVFLHHKNKAIENLPIDATIGIERLQSVARYTGLEETDHPDLAFANAADRIKECLRHLADFLSACQQSAPYLTS